MDEKPLSTDEAGPSAALRDPGTGDVGSIAETGKPIRGVDIIVTKNPGNPT